MKHGTYTSGTTPEQVIRDAFNDNNGFKWSLQGTDSRNADKLGLHNHNEETIGGYLAILGLLWDAIDNPEADTDPELYALVDWASLMRGSMLECIGIEEI